MSQNEGSRLSESNSSSMNVDLSPPPPPPSTPVSSKLFSNPSSSKSRPSKPPPPPPPSSPNPRVISNVEPSSKPDSSSSMEPNHQRCFLAVSGMSCSSCVKGIESTLLRQSGIYEVKVALISNSAEVVYDPLVISPEEIITILDGLGFDSKITSTSDSCNESELVVEIEEERDPNGNKLNANHLNGGLANWLLVEQELCRLIGVKSVKIDRTTMQITIFYFKEQIGPRTIVQTVAGQLKAGHQVRVVEFDAMQQSLKLMRADVRKWRQSFLISLLFTVPTVVAMIYFMHNEMAPPSPKQLHHSHDRKALQSPAELLLPGLNLKNLIFFLLATPVQLYTSRHFYLQSYRSIVLMHRANMDVLIAMATTVAYGYSVLIVVYAMICQYPFSPDTFFDTPPMMITFISLGRYIEHRTRLSATEALFQLCNSTPTDATLVHIESKTSNTATPTAADPKTSYAIIREESISVSLIETGDYLRVLPEQIIPVDGQVFDGQSRVCESLITGEPGEIVKLPGSILYGGSINRSGTILMRATGVGRDTTIAQIYKLIQEAQTTKPEVQKFADQIAGWFVPTVAALSASVFGIWLIVGHYFLKEISLIYPITSLSMTSTELVTQFAVLCAVNVLIISCPCALGIATPTAVAAASAIGLKLGLLIKGAIPLEQAGRIKYALIDKTGTITEGKPTVTGMKLLNRIGPKSGILDIQTQDPDKTTGLLLQKLFALIGIAETSSTHPIAYSVLNYVRQSLRMTPDSSFGVCSKFRLHTGMGVHCIVDASQLQLFLESINTRDSQYLTIDGNSTKISYAQNVEKNSAVTLDERWFETANSFSVLIGNKQLMNKYGIELGDDTEREMHRLEIKGETVFLVAINSMLIGMLSVADQIKENAALAVYTLKKKYGVQVIMLTGDNATSAWKVAKQVGINKVYAELLPAHKLQKIGELQEGGKTVAMIGDGLNDAPALQKANVGIAFALGNQIALNSAGIILVRNDILDVVVSLHLARKTTTRIFSNLLLAFIYNCIMIPAAGGLYFVFFGGMLRPWVSSLLMVLSSLSVVSNSLLLRKLYRKPTKQSLETEEFRRLYAMLRKTQYTNSSEIPAVHAQNGIGAATTTTTAGNYLKLDSSVSLMSLHGLGNLQEGTGVQNPEDIDRSRQKEIWAKVKNPSLDSNEDEEEYVSNAGLFIETIETSNNALGHRPNSNLIIQKNNENNQQSFGPNNV